jgi:hypothetical protein
MKGLVAAIEALLDEGAKHPVLLVEAIEKSANVTAFAKHAISDVDGTFVGLHGEPPPEWISVPAHAANFQKCMTILGLEVSSPALIGRVP